MSETRTPFGEIGLAGSSYLVLAISVALFVEIRSACLKVDLGSVSPNPLPSLERIKKVSLSTMCNSDAFLTFPLLEIGSGTTYS